MIQFLIRVFPPKIIKPANEKVHAPKQFPDLSECMASAKELESEEDTAKCLEKVSQLLREEAESIKSSL